MGELTKLTYPDSSIAERTYHDTGALHLLKLDGSTISTRTYDDGRRLTGETLGNGVTETRTYSTDNLLTGISNGGTRTSIGNLSYTWDANKNKTSETIGGTMSGYGFTSAGTTYDDEDRLTGYARTNGTFNQSWNLTKVGDWTSVTTNGTAQSRTHGPTHELLTAGGQNISTDVKGNITVLPANLTRQNSALGLRWDFDNKLRSADLGNNNSVDVNFQYDALGRRVARTGTGGSVVYVQHDQQTIADYPVGGVASTPTYRYVYASYIDEPVVRKAAGTGGTIHYFHRNQQYSITAMTTSSGAVAERYAYTAYGQPTILNASGTVLTISAVGNRYTYTGREWDETLGLHHFRARWMSPLAGRFLGRDPIGYIGSPWNMYEVLKGQSTIRLDPTGLKYLNDYPYDFPYTIPPKKHGICTITSCKDAIPDEIEVVPTFPGPNKKCKVQFVCVECEDGVLGTTPEFPHGGDPNWGDSFVIKICDRGDLEARSYNDVIEHELVHARDNCNPFDYGPDYLSDCDRCKVRERRAYRRQCEILTPGDTKAIEACVERGAENSCFRRCNPIPPNLS